MRVLFINRMISMVRGGGETFDIEMARHLQALGVSVSFLSGLPVRGSAVCPVTDFPSHTVRSPYTGLFPWDKIWQGWRIRVLDFQCFEYRAARWVKAHEADFDVIQICEMPSLIDTLRGVGVALPISIRITAPDYHDTRGAVARAQAVIASGTSIAMLHAGPRPDAHDIPNGVDTERFSPGSSSWRLRLGIPEDALVVLHVARFYAVKNHGMLLTAFAALAKHNRSAHLVLVGSGPLEPTVRQHIERLGLTGQVHLAGEVPYEAIPEVYRAGDINVISSYSESFSFATLEGMASGLPMVVTDTEWIPRLIGGGKGGRIVPVDDAGAFGAALCELADSAEEREKMGAFNRATVLENYQWPQRAATLYEIYDNLQSD